MRTLESLRPGSKAVVTICGVGRVRKVIATVDRVTKTQIIASGEGVYGARFSRATGKEIGGATRFIEA
jgi:hypothetical protein